MNKNSLTDLIYAFEIANKDTLISLYLDGELSQNDIVRLGKYFVNHLPEHHSVNGNVWATMCGIIRDYFEDPDPLEREITHKQAVYLISNLRDNIHEHTPLPY
jgi:hypothetical protein